MQEEAPTKGPTASASRGPLGVRTYHPRVAERTGPYFSQDRARRSGFSW